ncbi:inactive transglutaminase family protein [Thalassolituus sp.]|uniref:inactive transglutaminase family protein n=1 Tax=Thalassolituus sp. TaxID=2030822 RepID=UPI003517F594
MRRPSDLALPGLVTLLLLIGTALVLHRHWVYEVPLIYGETQTVWSLEARIEFTADGGPVKVSMARPAEQSDFTILRQSGASPGYGLNFIEGADPRAEWTVRAASGAQELYYQVDVLESDNWSGNNFPAPKIVSPDWQDPYRTAVLTVLEGAYNTSSDNFSFARELIKRFNQTDAPQHIRLLRRAFNGRMPNLMADILNEAQVPATVVYGLELEDGRRRQLLTPLLRVWQGGKSQIFRVSDSPDEELPLLLWEQRGAPVLDVIGGRDSRIRFSMIRREESTYSALTEHTGTGQSLLNFSIHSLPVEEQAMFKTILLLPVGALVVCILRILVGLRTSGTFMPVLFAVAFMQTSLGTGIVGFVLVVACGLFIRSYLSRLNLLLVARISAVIVTVIAIISLFSVLSYKLGMTEGLKIMFFPMVILAWTIERMSILWEEEGGKEVLIQGGGSLLTAALAYWAMQNPVVQHLTFNFMGVQFIIVGLIVMLGAYAGYRLSELRRFASFRQR